jgi:hypothetical protein
VYNEALMYALVYHAVHLSQRRFFMKIAMIVENFKGKTVCSIDADVSSQAIIARRPVNATRKCLQLMFALSIGLVSATAAANTIITATDPAPTVSSTQATAVCPQGMFPTGGGYIWPVGSGGFQRVSENRPTGAGSNGQGWRVVGTSAGNFGTLKPISAYVMCTSTPL